MPIALTIDQRDSRHAEDHAGEWANRLNKRFGKGLTLPFVRTVGDEIQALTGDAGVSVDILREGLRSEIWWLGLGIGEVESPLGHSAAESRGTAFYNARVAVESAKRSRYGFSVGTDDPALTDELETVLRLMAFVIRRRGKSTERWRAIELAEEGISTGEIGKALGISQQAASSRLSNAGVDEELRGRKMAIRLIEKALRERR